MTTILASVGDFIFSGQSSCLTTTVDRPVNTAIWFPVPKDTSILPSIPTVVVNTAIPGNSAPVDACFDPDNVDYFQLFNQLLPQEEVAPSYDRVITTEALLKPRHIEITIQAVIRSTLQVLRSSYSVAPVVVDVDVPVRAPLAAYDLVAKVEGENGVFNYTGHTAQLNRLRLIAPKRAIFALTGYAALLQTPGDKTLGAGTGSYKVNDAIPVLLLSHFDTEFDEQTGNTVGYNWYTTYKPVINTVTKKFGAGSLDMNNLFRGVLYTFLNPALYPEAVNIFTIECWSKKSVAQNYAIPFGIGPEANAENTGYFIELTAAVVRFKSKIKDGAVTTIFEGDIGAYEDPDFNHIVFEHDNGLAKIYYNGIALPNELLAGQPLQWPVGIVAGQLGQPIDLRSSIILGYYIDDPVAYTPSDSYGFIDEVRITEGIIYVGETFTPPNAAYTTDPVGLLQASFSVRKSIACVGGTFQHTGQDIVAYQPTKKLAASPATFVLGGVDIGLLKPSVVFLASTGSFSSVFVPSIDYPTYVTGSGAASTSSNIYLTIPGGGAIGDLAIIFVESSATADDSRPHTPPYGWTPVPGVILTDGNSYTSAFYKYRTTTSLEYVTLGTTSNHGVAVVAVIGNVDPNNPFVEVSTGTKLVSSTAVTFPSLTDVIPRTRLLELFSRTNDTSNQPNLTSRQNTSNAWVDAGVLVRNATSSGDGGGVAIYSALTTKQMPGLPGSTGTDNLSSTNTMVTIALRPKGWTKPPLVVNFAPVAGSYALVGQAAGLAVPLRTMGAADGTYTLVGYSASFEKGFILEAESATYSLGGQSAGLTKQWGSLVADAGAFVEVGQDIALLDGTADTYIAAVESADGQDLETTVKVAINKFITGCKADGTWSAIKAACILAGARTLAGALVPLAGTAPTNNNFVSGDYSRTTGLVGDGSTKYLDSNRNSNSDPNSSIHQSIYVSTALLSGVGAYIGVGAGNTGATHIISNRTTNELAARNRNSTANTIGGSSAAVGFIGSSRASSSSYSLRANGSSTVFTVTPEASVNANNFVFARNEAGFEAYTTARLSFYSIGESLDLALLDSRVTTLMSDIAAALP